MASSHPPTLITRVTRALREECGVKRGSRVLLALSGGGDSTALLHVLALLAKKQGFWLVAHGVDHGLRAEASLELDLAEAECARFGVPFSRSVLTLSAGGNLQARARDARRAALLAAAEQARADSIATAHHADDRAETVLLRLLRGAGPRGLAVLPPRSGVWIRPQLRARKADVSSHLARHELRFSEDPSNRNARFQRTRVRFELLPLLEQLSPQIVGHLCALADALGPGALADAPALTDELGVALVLNRAQRQLVGRARALGQRSARVSLANGRELSLDPVTLEPKLNAAGAVGVATDAPKTARKSARARSTVTSASLFLAFRGRERFSRDRDRWPGRATYNLAHSASETSTEAERADYENVDAPPTRESTSGRSGGMLTEVFLGTSLRG